VTQGIWPLDRRFSEETTNNWSKNHRVRVHLIRSTIKANPIVIPRLHVNGMTPMASPMFVESEILSYTLVQIFISVVTTGLTSARAVLVTPIVDRKQKNF